MEGLSLVQTQNENPKRNKLELKPRKKERKKEKKRIKAISDDEENKKNEGDEDKWSNSLSLEVSSPKVKKTKEDTKEKSIKEK